MSAEAALTGAALGSVTSFLAASMDMISANTNVPLGLVAGVFITITPFIWWLSRQFTKMDNRFETIEKSVTSIEADLARRPCHVSCPVPPQSPVQR